MNHPLEYVRMICIMKIMKSIFLDRDKENQCPKEHAPMTAAVICPN